MIKGNPMWRYWAMFAQVRVSVILIILGMCAVASADTATAPALPEDVLFIARGLEQSATGAIQQASGRATVKIQRNGNTCRQFEFYIDGDKKRWDMWEHKQDSTNPEEFALVSKQAFDGKAFYEFRYLMDGTPYPAAHVREPETWIPAGQSTYTGVTCDPRMLWLPRELAIDGSVVNGLRAHLRKGTVEVVGDITKDKTVTLAVTKDTHAGVLEVNADIEITNDGCIVKEARRLQNGQLVGRSIRDYERNTDTGLLVLTHLKDEGLRRGAESMHEYTISYTSINRNLPADTFNLKGFDLPFGTTIFDARIGGMAYKYGGDSKEIERTLSDLLSATAQEMEPDSGKGRNTATSQGDEGKIRDNASQPMEAHERTSMVTTIPPYLWWAIAAAIGAIIVSGIIILRARKKRPAK